MAQGQGERGKAELIEVLKEGLDGAVAGASLIGDRLVECSERLRVEHDEHTFRLLSEGVGDLGNLVTLVAEIEKGIRCLGPGAAATESFSSWERSEGLFRQMLDSLEKRDWISLADLIHYELRPLLAKGEQGLADLRRSLG